jgi:hypothetical protein
MEDLIGFDDLLVPKQNASQMGSEQDNGRPEKSPEESADSTNKEKEYR